MSTTNYLPLVVASIGSGGIGAFVMSIITGIGKLQRGVSARESKRRIDIVQQRDEAITREDEQRARADAADSRARGAIEYAARCRIQLINAGIEPGEDDIWAELQRTKQPPAHNTPSP